MQKVCVTVQWNKLGVVSRVLVSWASCHGEVPYSPFSELAIRFSLECWHVWTYLDTYLEWPLPSLQACTPVILPPGSFIPDLLSNWLHVYPCIPLLTRPTCRHQMSGPFGIWSSGWHLQRYSLPIFHWGSPRKTDPTKCQVSFGKLRKKLFFGGLGGVRFPGPGKVANCHYSLFETEDPLLLLELDVEDDESESVSTATGPVLGQHTLQ